MTRQATNKLLEMVEEGILDPQNVILACVNYMSEDDVAEMCRMNEYFEHEPDDDDDDDEDDDARERLEELRAALRAQNISWGELAELQELADHIEPDDVELREAAGLPEHE